MYRGKHNQTVIYVVFGVVSVMMRDVKNKQDDKEIQIYQRTRLFIQTQKHDRDR